ncbi:hypothetical protein [Brevifollis gellanilyticus]|uniref:hypothetical protein n=1 Tax=Brevifollis gellanilyticus TaxID=748831 RepID=UPI0011BF345A|nr:hypothetical protein [Brevifollis gellanilyticus]
MEKWKKEEWKTENGLRPGGMWRPALAELKIGWAGEGSGLPLIFFFTPQRLDNRREDFLMVFSAVILTLRCERIGVTRRWHLNRF